MESFWEGAEVISTYTRQQAIEDGVLVDVSETAREAGFKWPVALTRRLWVTIEDIPPSQSHQDTQGRLWDVLWMARLAARRGGDGVIFYTLIMHHGRKKYITLKMHAGPGDSFEPVLTIMLPDED